MYRTLQLDYEDLLVSPITMNNIDSENDDDDDDDDDDDI